MNSLAGKQMSTRWWVATGSSEHGEILQKLDPDIIAMGYDQIMLEKSLESYLRQVGLSLEIRVIGF